MTGFRCLPIEIATVERFRRTGTDDRGNAVLTMQPDAGPPRGIYWTPSPIFVHAQACTRFATADMIAPVVRNRLVSVRSYDAAGMCLYDLGEVCDGDDVEAPLFRALADDRARTINIHTARPGCLLCQVERS